MPGTKAIRLPGAAAHFAVGVRRIDSCLRSLMLSCSKMKVACWMKMTQIAQITLPNRPLFLRTDPRAAVVAQAKKYSEAAAAQAGSSILRPDERVRLRTEEDATEMISSGPPSALTDAAHRLHAQPCQLHDE